MSERTEMILSLLKDLEGKLKSGEVDYEEAYKELADYIEGMLS